HSPSSPTRRSSDLDRRWTEVSRVANTWRACKATVLLPEPERPSKATTRTREWCRGVARITSATCTCQPGRSVRTCIAVPLDLLVPLSKIFGLEDPEGGPPRSGAPYNTSAYRSNAG